LQLGLLYGVRRGFGSTQYKHSAAASRPK
jgi:hypothetical protein